MPKTKSQNIVFSVIMVFFMVFCMTCFSVARNMGGLNYMVFAIAIKEMWLEYVIAFLLISLLITKTAQKLAFRILTPGQDKPIFIILAIQSFTVCMMVPTMTLFATFVHGGIYGAWFTDWIQLAFASFPVALCLQIFFIGPLVRLIFRTIFRKSLS